MLDARQLRTPLKKVLAVPTRDLAELIAAEWDAVKEQIDPSTMPMTRMANAAIDKVTHQMEEVTASVAAYGGTDLICYRADGPEALVQRQAEGWDPMVRWAADTLGAELLVTDSVMPVEQPEASLGAFRVLTAELNVFQLTAFYDLVSLSGSLVLALALVNSHAPADEIWSLSRLDEDWQIEQWGEDEEASAMAEYKRNAFHDAWRFFQNC